MRIKLLSSRSRTAGWAAIGTRSGLKSTRSPTRAPLAGRKRWRGLVRIAATASHFEKRWVIGRTFASGGGATGAGAGVGA